MAANEDPIIVEQEFKTSSEVVWNAITNKDQMRQWYFETIEDFEPVVGFETEFNVHYEGRDFPHQWKVTNVVTGKLIAYSWKYGGYTGSSTVTWELDETSDGTRLKLTHDGQHTFAEDDPMFSREAGQAGWEYLLHKSLKEFLER